MCLFTPEGSGRDAVITKWDTKYRVLTEGSGTWESVEWMWVIASKVLGKLAIAHLRSLVSKSSYLLNSRPATQAKEHFPELRLLGLHPWYPLFLGCPSTNVSIWKIPTRPSLNVKLSMTPYLPKLWLEFISLLEPVMFRLWLKTLS